MSRFARPTAWLSALALASFAACGGAPKLPDGEGQGLVSFDRRAPSDARTVERPSWLVGDRFRFLQGGENHMTWRVAKADDDGYEIVEERLGTVTLLDKNLGLRGEDRPDDPSRILRLAPADHSFSWPLWVGKRWSAHYLRKIPDAALPVQADYVCDAWETVTVPAGTFECLRIWRRARPAVETDRYLENASISWFAPDVGYFVRKLEDGVLLELEDHHRQ